MMSMEQSKSRILFVDDELEVLEGLRRALRQKKDVWGMRYESSPQSAIEAMQDEPADVVVCDMNMPGITGLEMVIAMRQLAPQASYIMLTGSADLETAVEAINSARIFRFYTKPCPPDLLIEGIEAGLRASTSETRNQTENENSLASPSFASDNTRNISLSALNHLALSVIVVDRDARVLLTNRSGGELLSRRDGLILSGHEICRTSVTSETEELHRFIRQATADPHFDASTMALSRPSQNRALSVLVTPLAGDELGLTNNSALAILFISDPDGQPMPSPDAIAKVFDLTKAEARIVHALVQGHRLEDAAETYGITVGTARTYLKQVFSKTNTSRQSELIKLVLAYPRIATGIPVSVP